LVFENYQEFEDKVKFMINNSDARKEFGKKAISKKEEFIKDPESLGLEQLDGRCIYKKIS